MGVPKFFRGISVIPSVFFSTVAISLTFLAIPNILMQKTCSPSSQPDVEFVCHNPRFVADATGVATTRNSFRSVLSAVCVPVFATWRDLTGRSKPLLIIGMVAEMLGALMIFLSITNWNMPLWIPTMTESTIGGLFGQSILLLGANCIIIQNSTPENRTMRLQLFVTATFLGSCLSSAAYAFILPEIGYAVYFILILWLHLAAITFTTIFVSEKKAGVTSKIICPDLKTVFKSRDNNAVIWMMLLCGSLANTYVSAENSILIYYLQQGFHFTVQDEGIYDTYYSIIAATGSIVFPYFFMKVMEWNDFKIGIVSALITAVSAVIIASATTKLQLYLFTALGLLKCILYSIPESIISKCISNHELGKFLGMGSIVESFLPFAINDSYNLVFSETSASLPGAFYLLSAAIDIVVFFLFSFSSILYQPIKDGGEDQNCIEAENSECIPVKIWVTKSLH